MIDLVPDRTHAFPVLAHHMEVPLCELMEVQPLSIDGLPTRGILTVRLHCDEQTLPLPSLDDEVGSGEIICSVALRTVFEAGVACVAEHISSREH
jgi:hypothetical protein